jgi:hypothetical protein
LEPPANLRDSNLFPVVFFFIAAVGNIVDNNVNNNSVGGMYDTTRSTSNFYIETRVTSRKAPGKGCVLCGFDKDGEWTKFGKKVGGQFCNPVFALDKDGPKQMSSF